MCGVWIASWADDDEQYKEEQPREGLFLAGAVFYLGRVRSALDEVIPSSMVVAISIYRGPGPLPKY